MKYIENENTSEIRIRQATGTMRKRRRRRHKYILSLALTATLIFGIWQAVSSMTDRQDNMKNDSLYTGEGNVAGKDEVAGESDTLSQLKALAKENSEIETIVQNADTYPESLLKLLVGNQETLSFVQNYPNRNSDVKSSGLTQDDLTGEIPLFLQWDKRWGYNEYGNDMLAITGCGPTSLSMVIVGLTGDLSADPGAVAAFSQSHGFWVDGKGTDWGLMTSGAEAYGLKATEVPLWENSIIKQLQAGHPVICAMGPGVFTTTGHFIVIYGYENGEFLINDPNSLARSEQRWTYSSFESQVSILWAYSTK